MGSEVRGSPDGAFGQLLKRRRFAAGLSQAELAERAKTSPQYISMLEGDTRRPGASMVRKLADALDLASADREHFLAVAVGEAIDAQTGGSAEPGSQAHDIFISFAPGPDLEHVLALRRALETEGLSVWLDERRAEIMAEAPGQAFQHLADSLNILIYYSKAYLGYEVCQRELTAALVAVQGIESVPNRILVVNPEPSSDHIVPAWLRDGAFAMGTCDEELRRMATRLAQYAADASRPSGIAGHRRGPLWHPVAIGERQFIGRIPDLFAINEALHHGGRAGLPAAQIVGMGGVGKTVLAAEYASRFGTAYAGGVFWLSAPGDDADDRHQQDSEQPAALLGQLRAIADSLGVSVIEPTVEAIRGRIARDIEIRGAPCLWVVDDLPSDLTLDQARQWFAPHPLASTLVTTRGRRYESIAVTVPLGAMQVDDALDLLTVERKPVDEAERSEAARLAEDLGHHALALNVAGAALRLQEGMISFAEFRAELASPDLDVLELADELARDLPVDHRRSIAGILLRSIRRLGSEGLDLVLLASCLAARPVPPGLLVKAFALIEGVTVPAARPHSVRAVAQASRLSLAEPVRGGGWLVHTLISRAARRHHQHSERRLRLRRAAIAVLIDELRHLLLDADDTAGLDLLVAHAREVTATVADRDEAELLGWVARYQLEVGDDASAVNLYRRQVAALENLLPPDHLDIVSAMGNLACALRGLGDVAGATEHEQRVLDVRGRVLGTDHPRR